MTIQQAKKQSDLEKRLRILHQQVYGRNSLIKIEESNSSKSTQPEVRYLYQDLTKIATLASVALGIQIISFILLKNHILNLKFF